ncbi:hypothetical protein JCM10908_002774 [Rhodotorula pacifica]|uniref:uncharacterized protein n=1 Tax=Rhodotorula pacifica TaxID=1495444 RepID=UPI00317E63D9
MSLLRALARGAAPVSATSRASSRVTTTTSIAVGPHRLVSLPSTRTAKAPHQLARFLSTSTAAWAPARASTGSVESGQGGRAEKDKAKAQAAKDKKAKEKERKEKEKVKKQQQRVKAKEQREKEKEKKLRERERARALRQKTQEERKKSSTRTVLRPPKVPQNSWQIFFEEFIAEKKRSLAPGEKLPTVTTLTQEAAPQYRSLDEEAKHSLQQRYQAARDAYPAILDAWQKTLTPEMIRRENTVRANRRKAGLSRKRALRLDGEPKKPITPFFRFCNEIRAEGSSSTVLQGETDVTKQSSLLAQAWKALSEEERKPYHDAYAGAQEQYKRDKAEWDAEQQRTASLQHSSSA